MIRPEDWQDYAKLRKERRPGRRFLIEDAGRTMIATEAAAAEWLRTAHGFNRLGIIRLLAAATTRPVTFSCWGEPNTRIAPAIPATMQTWHTKPKTRQAASTRLP